MFPQIRHCETVSHCLTKPSFQAFPGLAEEAAALLRQEAPQDAQIETQMVPSHLPDDAVLELHGLASVVSDEDVRSAMSVYGTVNSAKHAVFDGAPTGVAYVVFAEARHLLAAFAALSLRPFYFTS